MSPKSRASRHVPDDDLSRRHFLTALSAGSLILMAHVADGQVLIGATPPADDASFRPDLYIAIARDGAVTILAHRSDMGTGIRTCLPRVLADELEADWSRVTIVQAPGDRRLGDQNTDGSNSIRLFFHRMRVIGATARTMLERSAAEQWGVPADECHAEQHQVVHRSSERRVSFGELVPAACMQKVPQSGEVKLKDRKQWRYIGTDFQAADLDDMVTGRAIFGSDVRMDNQLQAVIARPPVAGGRVATLDASRARAIPGVVDVVELPRYQGAPRFQPLGGVAVCATNTWAALRGRDALKIEWDDGVNGDYDSDIFAKELLGAVNRPGLPLRQSGDLHMAAVPAMIVQADYSLPHLAHAPMETPCAVASVTADEHGIVRACHVIASTQNPQAVQEAVGAALGMPAEQVLVNVTLLGTGFGRKSKPDYCVEAAMLSRHVQRPVHVLWTREDDLRNDYFHAISVNHVEAVLNDKGLPIRWVQRAAYPSITSTFDVNADRPADWEAEKGLTDLPFDIPSLSLEVCQAKARTRIGWLRSVCHLHQNFASCSFADELAHRAQRDPLDYLLELLGEDREIDLQAAKLTNRGASPEEFPFDIGRLKNVLRRAAKEAGWERRERMPEGTGLGIACCRALLGYTAHVVEVTVASNGAISIPRVWASIDAGIIVNPDRVRAQIEGAAVMAATQALFGSIAFKNGRTVETNYNRYKMLRMHNAPREVLVDIVDSHASPAGVGEIGVPSLAPALCNAIFSATGVRIRDLPILTHQGKWRPPYIRRQSSD